MRTRTVTRSTTACMRPVRMNSAGRQWPREPVWARPGFIRVPAEPQRASAGRMRCVLFYSGRKIVQQRSEERSEDRTEKEGGKSYGKKAKGTVQTRHCSALEGTKEKWMEKSLQRQKLARLPTTNCRRTVTEMLSEEKHQVSGVGRGVLPVRTFGEGEVSL